MKLSIFHSCSLLVVALAAPATVMAANTVFMKDAPYTHFTAEDKKMFHALLDDTLNKGADGDAREWFNPATKAGGSMKPLKSFEKDGLPCRALAIENHAKSRKAKGEYQLCKQASGKWAISQ